MNKNAACKFSWRHPVGLIVMYIFIDVMYSTCELLLTTLPDLTFVWSANFQSIDRSRARRRRFSHTTLRRSLHKCYLTLKASASILLRQWKFITFLSHIDSGVLRLRRLGWVIKHCSDRCGRPMIIIVIMNATCGAFVCPRCSQS